MMKVDERGIVECRMWIGAVVAVAAGCKILPLMRISQQWPVSSFVVLHAGLAVTFAVASGAEFEFALAIVAAIEVVRMWASVVVEYVAVV